MHSGFNSLRQTVRTLLTISALVFLISPLSAQSVSSTGQTAPAVGNLLEQGRSFELNGQWGEALTHYEDALRDYPKNTQLQQRFDYARLHYSLQRRQGDRSFRSSVQTLKAQEALDMYGELLLKIDTHYFDSPDWRELASRGVRAVDIALENPAFRNRHRVRASQEQLAQLSREMQQTMSRSSLRTKYDATKVAADVARLAAYRVGLRQSATLMEFTAAAAGGLDEYSSFLTSDQLRDVYSQIEGNFVGLGVELKPDNGALLIVHVIPGSPAQRSGIQAQDRIVAVDGKLTSTYSTDEAAAMLTGEEGTFVRVTIERIVDERTAQFEETVRREHVDVPSLEEVGIVDEQSGVAYVRIPAFQKTTSRDMEAALWQLHKKGMRSLIIDLRGNPGGLLTASVELADKFIAQGPIVSTRGRSQAETFDYRAHRVGTWRVPLVVLIDGDSASASEIFAAAIKDAKRGKIIGSRSYGKGSVQGIFPLGYAGTGIRLTTAKFYSPEGRPISKVGVHPDIDTRHATQTIQGHAAGGDGAFLVGYRGPQAGSAEDSTLATAVEAVRNELPPAL